MRHALRFVGRAGHFPGALEAALAMPGSVLVVNTERGSFSDFSWRLRAARAVATDFDGTINEFSHWPWVKSRMRLDDWADDEAATVDYFTNPNRNEATDRLFIANGAARIVRSGLTREMIAAAVQGLPPRAGAVELINSFRGEAALISLGVKPYIETWAMSHGLERVEVYALDLVWQDNMCVGYRPETIVTDHGKEICFRDFCRERRLRPANTLVLGDDWTDRGLFAGGGLNIFVFPKHDRLAARVTSRNAAVVKLWSVLDAVLVGDSLEPLVEILRAAR